jgi:DNA-binding response OmpR family regulator
MAQILVIDNDRPFADVLASVLRLEGHDVIVADSADEGVELGVALRPDVVVAHWMLGGDLHGGEACRLIQAACPSVKTILTTGYNDGVSQVRRWRDYADTLLEKPFHKEAIVEAVNRALAEAGAAPTVEAGDILMQS